MKIKEKKQDREEQIVLNGEKLSYKIKVKVKKKLQMKNEK